MPAKIDNLRYDITELMKSGGFNEIIDRCHVELTLARREKNHSVEVIALLGLAQAQCSLGHFDFARDYVSQAVDGADALGSKSLMTDALVTRARVAREGYLQTAEAFDDYLKAVDYSFEAGDMSRYGQSLLGLGEIGSSPDESSKHAWKVIDIARELNDEQMEARAILMLSNAFIRRQDFSKANDGLLVALRKAQSAGDRLLQSVIIGQQGLVLAQDSDTFERGIQQQLTALEVARGMESVFHEFMRLYTLAMTMLTAKDMSDARDYLDQMLALSQDIQHPALRDVCSGNAGGNGKNCATSRMAQSPIIRERSRWRALSAIRPARPATCTRLAQFIRHNGILLARGGNTRKRAPSTRPWTIIETPPVSAPRSCIPICSPSPPASCDC